MPSGFPSEEAKTDFTFQGKPIVLAKQRGQKFTGLTKMGIDKGIYPEKMKVQAATFYAATGSFERASELSTVPEGTIRVWRKQEWFQDLLSAIRDENNEVIDAKFTAIVEKALDQVLDRLDNGDFHVTPKGELVRKPVGVRDLSLVSAINIDKRQLLRGLPTSRSETSVSKQDFDRLEKLKETFEALANKTRKPILIEVKDDYKESEGRLQGSVGEGQELGIEQESGGSQETPSTS